MRYFITGATGFIGNHLARIILSEGHEVAALVRTPHKARDLKALGASIFQGDITDRKSIAPAMKGADGVFHVAARYALGLRARSGMRNINVGGTKNVLRTMKELRIPKGVYTSSIVVNSDTNGTLVDETYYFDGDHLSEYARTKWEAHYSVAKSMIYEGLPLVIVQPSTVYGPGDHSAIALMFSDHLKRRLPAVPVGSLLSWAHVEDVARGHFLAMNRGQIGESYYLSGPTHSIAEAVQIAARISRRPAPPFKLSPGTMRFGAQVAGLIEPHFKIPSHYSSEALFSSAGTSLIASYQKAVDELGYSPRELKQGLKGTLTDLAARISEEKKRPRRGR